MKKVLVTVFAAATGLFAAAALASEPLPWQMGLQPAASPTAEGIHDLHNMMLVIITCISVFVLGLLMYTCWRFRESRNPTPSKTWANPKTLASATLANLAVWRHLRAKIILRRCNLLRFFGFNHFY